MTSIITRRRFTFGAGAAAALPLSGRPRPGTGTARGRLHLCRPDRRLWLDLAHDQGRKALEEEFGDKVKTSYVENVAEGPDAERVHPPARRRPATS